jgi:hypothetical protein
MVQRSVPEILVLQWQIDVSFLQQAYYSLQIVALLTRNPQFLTLDRRLNLQFARFYFLYQVSRQWRIDALSQYDFLPRFVSRNLDFLFLHAGNVDAPFCKFLPQDVEHLLQLEFSLTGHGDDVTVEDVPGPGSLEIETRVYLAIGLIDRIAGFMRVVLADDVK